LWLRSSTPDKVLHWQVYLTTSRDARDEAAAMAASMAASLADAQRQRDAQPPLLQLPAAELLARYAGLPLLLQLAPAVGIEALLQEPLKAAFVGLQELERSCHRWCGSSLLVANCGAWCRELECVPRGSLTRLCAM
jgi:hypothetical protein